MFKKVEKNHENKINKLELEKASTPIDSNLLTSQKIDIQLEVTKLTQAIETVKMNILKSPDYLNNKNRIKDVLYIFEIEMFSKDIKKIIQNQHQTAICATQIIGVNFYKALQAISHDEMNQRANDLNVAIELLVQELKKASSL